MAYFPFFMDIGDEPCLIVGGGTVALRKAEKLLPYGPRITVISPCICEGIKTIGGLTLIERAYEAGDEEDFSFVIAATDDRETNRLVSTRCRKRRIPVNAVDDRELCSFIFPTLVKRGDLSIGISTSGASPSAAIVLKERINEMLPASFGEILGFLNETRERMKEEIGTESERHAILARLCSEALVLGRPLTDEEVREIMEEKR